MTKKTDHGRLIDADSNADGLWAMLLEVYNMPGLHERMYEIVGDVILNYTKENRVDNDQTGRRKARSEPKVQRTVQ